MTAEILSIGAYVPEKILTNDDVAKMVDTSDEWIKSHTGIETRHIVADDESASDLAYKASLKALERAGISGEELDMIILGTASGDYAGFPSTACVVQNRLGARRAGAVDITAGCTGFVYGLEMAKGLILTGSYKNILVIGVEALSRITDWSDRDTCVLFGDGAGAAVVTANTSSSNGRGIIHSILRSEGEGGQYLTRKAGGSKYPIVEGKTPYKERCIQMDGQKVYHFAVRVNTVLIKAILEENNLTIDDIKYIVPHQANIRIIQASAKRSKIPLEKYYVNIAKYANTSAASIPIALNEMSEKGLLSKGDTIITVGFGAGLTYGANLIRW